MLSSSMPISSGFSKRLWLIEVLPKSHSFHNLSGPSRTFSAFKSLKWQRRTTLSQKI
uniref:Uncharacterized protein n=1 Tax=Rhizophora mucronata TaxID=61149 RepID=A0A2P2KED7_RHIMU